MAQGKVKHFDEQKGSGVIVDEAGKEFTFTKNTLEAVGLKSLAEGDAVSFDIEAGARSMKAVGIKKL